MATNWHDRRATQEVARVAVAVTGADNTLVAAVTGKRIRVLAFVASLTGTAPTARFESGTGGTALTGAFIPNTGLMVELPYNPVGWFETAAGALLNLELGGTTPSAQGVLIYALVDDDRRDY
jgi:hypothetical protein